MKSLYFDHNATTPIAPEVVDALAECHAARFANPASAHRAGGRARRALDDARENIGRLLGAQVHSAATDRVIFTSGGTEANNLALLGLVKETPGHVIISAIEHPSVVGTAEELARRGWQVDKLPVSVDGVVAVEVLPKLLRPDTQLVSVMLGNNETGVLQPVAELAKLCAAAGVSLHTDAVQAAGKSHVDFRALGVSAMTVSAHKLGGPVGVGALIVRHGTAIRPIMHGGAQQLETRPGTESVALAVGLRAALEVWDCDRDEIVAKLSALRDRFEAQLRAGAPEIVIHGANSPRLPHTSNVAFPGVEREALTMALDLAGVECSTGSACASGSTEPSPTLVAMGVPASQLHSALRFSFGRLTTTAEIDEGASRILRVYNDLRSRKSAGNLAPDGRYSAAKPV
ncbi:MAG: cysteine desulfurase [Planctomycetes bacterium]|nr:cysteine desulfurase [Planctomycetota bacterium]